MIWDHWSVIKEFTEGFQRTVFFIFCFRDFIKFPVFFILLLISKAADNKMISSNFCEYFSSLFTRFAFEILSLLTIFGSLHQSFLLNFKFCFLKILRKIKDFRFSSKSDSHRQLIAKLWWIRFSQFIILSCHIIQLCMQIINNRYMT